jgi:exosortase A-associated hydrolase 1
VTCAEQAISFECGGETLIGVMAVPGPVEGGTSPCLGEASSDTGVVIVVGGPQYRAGSHRQFTVLARTLAAAGYPVLRFDYRGMGDSTGSHRDFESVNEDVAAAIGALSRDQPGVRRVVLWGLCDGASAALLYLHATRDSRVHAVCIANPWVRSEAGLARAHVKHYYLQRLGQFEFWRKAFSGQVAGKAARGLWRNLVKSFARPDRGSHDSIEHRAPSEPFQSRMASAAARFEGDLLLVSSGRDLTAKEFEDAAQGDAVWRRALSKPTCTRLDFPDADHTFSASGDLRGLQMAMLSWLDSQRLRRGSPR